MRRALTSLLILLFAGSILVIGGRGEPAARAATLIRAEAVALDVRDPARDRIGELRYLGGWVLTSDDEDFGGISALALDDGEFVAVSDAGGVFRFALGADGAVTGAQIDELPDGPAPPEGRERSKEDRDSESLAFDPATGRFWLGFEHANAIWRYEAGFARAEAHRAPAAMRDWPDNGGPEAMVRLADGRFLVFSEEADGPAGSRELLLFAGDPSEHGPAPLRLGYRPPEGFAVTDAAQLPDGRLLLLNRRFTVVEGVSVILSIADWAEPGEGDVVEGRVLATFRPPLTIDNMEALAVAEEDGRTVIWMASDDNFNPLQRTLLFKFELVGPR